MTSYNKNKDTNSFNKREKMSKIDLKSSEKLLRDRKCDILGRAFTESGAPVTSTAQ